MSRERRKGTAWEVAVCEYLASHGHPYAERRASRGRNDGGDISGVVGWTLEAKSLKQLDVAGAVDEAEKERANTGSKWAAAILKRRMKSTGEGYVVMTLATFARLLSEEGSG